VHCRIPFSHVGLNSTTKKAGKKVERGMVSGSSQRRSEKKLRRAMEKKSQSVGAECCIPQEKVGLLRNIRERGRILSGHSDKREIEKTKGVKEGHRD